MATVALGQFTSGANASSAYVPLARTGQYASGEAQPTTRTVVGSGGVTVSGSAVVTRVNLTHASHVGSGGVTLSGAAPTSSVSILHASHIGSGGLSMGGSAPTSSTTAHVYVHTGSGGASVSGTAEYSWPTPVLGAMSVVPPAMFAVSMTGAFGGILTVAMGRPTATMTAIVGVAGTLDIAIPRPTASLTLQTAYMKVVSPRPGVVMLGAPGVTGTLGVRAPAMYVYMGAATPIMAALSVHGPRLGVSLSGVQTVLGSASITFRKPRVSMSGFAGVIGAMSVDMQLPTVSLGGYSTISGVMSVRAPRPRAELLGALLPTTYRLFMVVNTVTSAISFYEGLATNSMCKFGDQFLFADANGVYVQDGADDAGAPIDASFEFGIQDFGSVQQKRVANFYAGLRADSQMTLTVNVDEATSAQYTLDPYDVPTLQQRRVEIGKGLRGKYWQFSLENTDGCYFDFDSFTLSVTELSRRI